MALRVLLSSNHQIVSGFPCFSLGKLLSRNLPMFFRFSTLLVHSCSRDVSDLFPCEVSVLLPLGPCLLVSPVLSLLSLSQGLSVYSVSSDLPVFGGLYPFSSLSAQILISLRIFTWDVMGSPIPSSWRGSGSSLSPSHFSDGAQLACYTLSLCCGFCWRL